MLNNTPPFMSHTQVKTRFGIDEKVVKKYRWRENKGVPNTQDILPSTELNA